MTDAIKPHGYALMNCRTLAVDVSRGIFRHSETAISAAGRATNRFQSFVAIPLFGPEVAVQASTYDLIETLRSGEEGDSVTLCASNPDFGGPNDVVICNGAWTAWEDRRFEGDSVFDCLTKAIAEHPSSVKS